MIESVCVDVANHVSIEGTHRRRRNIVNWTEGYFQRRNIGWRKSIARRRHHVRKSWAEHSLLFGGGSTEYSASMLQGIRQTESTHVHRG